MYIYMFIATYQYLTYINVYIYRFCLFISGGRAQISIACIAWLTFNRIHYISLSSTDIRHQQTDILYIFLTFIIHILKKYPYRSFLFIQFYSCLPRHVTHQRELIQKVSFFYWTLHTLRRVSLGNKKEHEQDVYMDDTLLQKITQNKARRWIKCDMIDFYAHIAQRSVQQPFVPKRLDLYLIVYIRRVCRKLIPYIHRIHSVYPDTLASPTVNGTVSQYFYSLVFHKSTPYVSLVHRLKSFQDWFQPSPSQAVDSLAQLRVKFSSINSLRKMRAFPNFYAT